MAVIRTVSIPLTREPEILFGLRISDLIWIMAAVVSDLALWHGLRTVVAERLAFMALASAGGLGMAVIRLHEASLPEWIVRWARFWLSPHLYLP